MEHLAQLLADALNLPPEIVSKLLVTVLVLVFLWVIRRVILALVHKRVADGKARYSWRKGRHMSFTAWGYSLSSVSGLKGWARWQRISVFCRQGLPLR